jgi:hypothetical protein
VETVIVMTGTGSHNGAQGDQDLRFQLRPDLIEDFVLASQRLYDSLDYDPFHGCIVTMGHGLPREEALWLSIVYMAFYNIGTAAAVFAECPNVASQYPDWMARMPVGVQRRNLRGGLVVKHLQAWWRIKQQYGSLYAYLTKGFVGDSKKDWAQLKANVDGVWGNGRWSTYTLSELFQKANKLPVLPCDIMNEGSSGPRAGLQLLYGCPGAAVAELDVLADRLFAYMRERINTNIFYLPKGHYDYGQLESQLCDFNSMYKGRYYIGRDIDRDLERVAKAESALKVLGRDTRCLHPVWAIREKVFDRRYLGEFQGWSGRTQQALQFYQRTGVVADHKTILESNYRRYSRE